MAKAVKAVGTALVIVGAVALTGGAALMGGFAGATTLFGVSAQTLIGVGSLVSSVGGALSKPKVGGGGSPVTWTADPNAPLHFAAGRIGVAGQIVYRAAYGPNDRMYQSLISVVSAAGPIDGWESFKADDTSVTFDASGKANSSYYANVMWRQTRLGSQPDTALTSPSGLEGGASLPNWNASYRLSGKASYILTLSENSKRSAYSGREPAPLNVVRGLKVYDPRLDSTYPGGSGPHRLSNPATWTYSQNPILWALKWELGLWEGPTGKGAPQVDQQVGGIGSHIDAIDVASYVEAANIADANGWTVAAWPSTADDKSQVLDAFLQAGGAYYIQRAGKSACLHRAAPRASVATISARDTAGPIEIDTSASRLQRKNALVPSIWSEADGWQITAIEEVSNETWITEDGGRKRSEGVTFPYVSKVSQGAQLACLQIAHTREGISGRIPLKPYMQGITAGDAFTIVEEGFVLNGLKCLALETEYDASTGVHTVTFVSETDGKYPFALGQTQTPPAPPTLTPVDPTLVQGPGAGDWTVTVPGPAPDGTQFPTIDLTGVVGNENADAVLVSWRAVAEEEDPDAAPDFLDSNGDIIAGWVDAGVFAPTTRSLTLTGPQSGAVIWIAVRYKRGSNVSAPRLIGPIAVQTLIANPNDGSGDTEPPEVPTGLTLSSTATINPVTGQPWVKIIATWGAVAAEDLDHYDVEITEGGFTITEWAGPDEAPRYERSALTGRVYSMRVRAVDTSGNASEWTAVKTITGAGDTVAPSAPTGLTTVASLAGVYVRGTAPSASDLARIDLYENTSNSTSGATRIAQLAASPGGAWSFTRAGLATGQTRWFFARAIDTSGNESGFSTGVSGTAISVTTADFASGLTAPFIAANNADASAKVLAATGSSSSAGYLYLNTTDRKLYRGTGGSNWSVATDGADITANTVTGGVFLAGAITAREIGSDEIQTRHLGARIVTAEEVAIGTLTGDLVAANTLEGSNFRTNTNLPGTIVLGSTGVTITDTVNWASNPAARVNAGTTLIQPGKIMLTGATSLSSWLLGSDNTLIDGGKIGANSVDANKLTIGARGLNFVGLDFTATNNVLSWSSGEVQYVDDNGTPQVVGISAGSATSAGRLYVYWQKGATSLSTGNLAAASASDRVIVCSFFGGANFTATYGRTIIDGPFIKTGAITADKMNVATLSAITADVGTVTAGLLRNGAGNTFFDLNNGRQQFAVGNYAWRQGAIGTGVVCWFGPASVAIGQESRTNGAFSFGTDGVTYKGDAPLGDGGGGDVTVTAPKFSMQSANCGGDFSGNTWIDASNNITITVASGQYMECTFTGSATNSSNNNRLGEVRLVHVSSGAVVGSASFAAPSYLTVPDTGNDIASISIAAMSSWDGNQAFKIQMRMIGTLGGYISVNANAYLSSYAPATSSSPGFMSAADKAKLDSLSSGGGGGSSSWNTLTDRPTGLLGSDGSTGYISYNRGDGVQPGWVGFHTANGTRRGWIGRDSGAASRFVISGDNGWPIHMASAVEIAGTATVNGTVISQGAGVGSVRMVPGDATHTGWLGFYDWNGARRGYVGFGTNTGRLTFTADTGAGTPGFEFAQNPYVGSNVIYHAGNLGAATTSAAGLMAAADKTKLNGIAAGATANSAESTSAVGGTLVKRTGISGWAASIEVNDVLATRGNGAGALFLGSTSRYLYWDTSKFVFNGAVEGTSFTPTSDELLKANFTIVSAPDQALAEVMQVEQAEWDSLQDDEHRLGFSAQAAREINPLWVKGGAIVGDLSDLPAIAVDEDGEPPASAVWDAEAAVWRDAIGLVFDPELKAYRAPLRLDTTAMLSSAMMAIRSLSDRIDHLERRLEAS